MRWYILKTLLQKEALRHLADRGGIFLALLLMAGALLLSLLGETGKAAGSGVNAVRWFYVDYQENFSPWIGHLQRHVPTGLRVEFRHASRIPTEADGVIHYQPGTAAVQIHGWTDHSGRPHYRVLFWQPSNDPAEIAPLADWFWRETLRYFRTTPLVIDTESSPPFDPDNKAMIEVRPMGSTAEGKIYSRFIVRPLPENAKLDQWLSFQSPSLAGDPVELTVENRELGGPGEERTMIATGLVVFSICFFCVYLLPAMTCEERERGILLAQVLSPASTSEIFLAKFLFYPTLGLILGATLAGIYRPAVLLRPFFWMSMSVTAVGYMGVGLTIASLARSQRRASLAALCYMLAIALFLLICQQNTIFYLPNIALEYHAPRIIHAALAGKIEWYHRRELVGAAFLAVIWTGAAGFLFKRRGWQ